MNRINVLDHGFVRLVDYMGNDLSIVRSARTSFDAAWRTGKNTGSDHRLINYLYEHGHNTPFESVTFTFEVKAPIFVIRQWHRHRTWCLSGDTRLMFKRPCDDKPYWKTLKEIAEQWYAPEIEVKRPDKQKRTVREFKRDLIRNMDLYCIENGEQIATTRIANVFQSGIKPVFKMSAGSKNIKASADHRFLTENGWKKLKDIKVGDKILSIGRKAKNEKPQVSLEPHENERWIATAYDGIEASDQGRIKRNGKIINGTVNTAGRLVISVKHMNRWKTVQVSHLVLKTFRDGSGHVLHKDDDPLNNRLENLYYGTDLDNHRDAKKNGYRAYRAVTAVTVDSIELVGEEPTYDIEVDHTDHNFIANGFCTHNSYNEVSARYTELPEEFYVPDPTMVGLQKPKEKQRRDEAAHNPLAQTAVTKIKSSCEDAFEAYRLLLDCDVPREIARSVLPVSTYTHMFGTVNLNNLFKFCRERCDEHAQYEIRVYADALLELIEPIVPVALEAYHGVKD